MIKHVLAVSLLCLGANASAANATPQQFTLDCASLKTPPPPIRRFEIDVNLELKSYYTDIGGLDEVDKVDEHEMLFRRHGCDVHGLPCFVISRFSCSDGLFFDANEKQASASCSLNPPRKMFKATAKYNAPNQ